MTKRVFPRVVAAVAAPILLLTGCAIGGETGSTESKTGGTLKLAGLSDVMYLDPAAAYNSPDQQIHRALTRTIFAKKNVEGVQNVLPDLALEIPTVENGGISEDGLVYTIEIQDGVNFDAPSGAREIVAEDIVRAAHRICNPIAPSAVVSYFSDTIVGLSDYCQGFAEVEPTVEAIRAYVEGNEIPGVVATGEHTVQFTIKQPASDFIDILALSTFMAPQPEEYLDFLPDSPELRQNIISSGPYRIVSYVPDESMTLERNPNWDSEKDPIRGAYVDAIEIAMGQESASVQQQLEAGTVDMQWADAVIPSASVPGLIQRKDERLTIGNSGTIDPYISINTLSPNADGAFGNPKVRVALNFAVNRAAIQQTMGGPDLAKIATEILPSFVLGQEPTNVLGLPDEGDPEKAKQLLAEAGYDQPVPITILYRETEPSASIAAILQQDLALGGFAPELKVTPANAFYAEFLRNKDVTRAGGWDIAIAAWSADFMGGRGYLVPMLDGRKYEAGSPNFGGWNNPEFNAEIDAALATTDPDEANAHWAQASEIAMKEAVWVPVTHTQIPVFRSSRVGGFEYLSSIRNGDITNVWLNE